MNSDAVSATTRARLSRARATVGSHMIDVDPGHYRAGVYLTARRHVDYGRVRSAMCPA
jgi:hypothetical protein